MNEVEPAANIENVARFWNANPCGSRLANGAESGTPEFFERTEGARYALEPFIRDFARFEDWTGQKVLEVGCGTGADLSMFARCGAQAWGIDLTHNGASLASKRLAYRGCEARVAVGDSESLPFPDGMFDLVYSWGVIHHTANTPLAARELTRVARPGGCIIAMIYNRRSLVALQTYLYYGLGQGKPRQSLRELMAAHLESPGTKGYTLSESQALFAGLENVRVTPVVTPYDLRIGRDRFLPAWMRHLVPRQLGYFIVIEGVKPLARSAKVIA
jgi:SAM-dependent methyltransferase